jgi:hypothetical protein
LRLREGRGEEECSQDWGFHEGSVSGQAGNLCGSSPTGDICAKSSNCKV